MQVRNPQYAVADNSLVDMEIEHPEYGWIPFSANPNDVEQHGRELFAQAIAGQFGEIAPYVPPSNEVLAQTARNDRNARLFSQVDPIVSNPLRWNDLTQVQKDALVAYRQALLDIPDQAGFPTQIDWPVYPL